MRKAISLFNPIDLLSHILNLVSYVRKRNHGLIINRYLPPEVATC